jgi:hypothetical protein
MNTQTISSPVAIGDKIIPLPMGNGDWYGIDEWYWYKTGTVTEVYDDSVLAEFPSRQKPDDSVSYLVCRWRKRPTTGDTVRVIDRDYDALFGKIGRVDIDDQTSLPYWVKGLYADNSNRGTWFTEQQVEIVQDGQTLTVSYTPQQGDNVVAWNPNIPLDNGDGPYPGVYDHTANGQHWVRGDFNRAGIFFARVEPDPSALRKGETLVITGRTDIWNGREVVYVGPEVGSVSRHEVTWNGDTLYFSEAQLTRPIATDVVNEEPEIVKELRFQLERANERVTEATDRAGKWERDFMRSWERIGREATERDWCSEYERVVSDVEGDLEIGTIPARVRLVEKRVRIRGEVYRDVTVWVPEGDDAGDADNWYESNDPDDKCSEEFMTEQIESEFENNGWDETSISVLR